MGKWVPSIGLMSLSPMIWELMSVDRPDRRYDDTTPLEVPADQTIPGWSAQDDPWIARIPDPINGQCLVDLDLGMECIKSMQHAYR